MMLQRQTAAGAAQARARTAALKIAAAGKGATAVRAAAASSASPAPTGAKGGVVSAPKTSPVRAAAAAVAVAPAAVEQTTNPLNIVFVSRRDDGAIGARKWVARAPDSTPRRCENRGCRRG